MSVLWETVLFRDCSKMTSCKTLYDNLYGTKKCTMFYSVKDNIPTYQKSNVVNTTKCPGCEENYVRKTRIT